MERFVFGELVALKTNEHLFNFMRTRVRGTAAREIMFLTWPASCAIL